ncbi:MAG: hypothetical protein ACU4EQ_13235 [Candidatus Nitrosoglobus sp.]
MQEDARGAVLMLSPPRRRGIGVWSSGSGMPLGKGRRPEGRAGAHSRHQFETQPI